MATWGVFLLAILCYLSYYGKADQVNQMKLSKEEDLEIEKQLKLLNKPSLKTIKVNIFFSRLHLKVKIVCVQSLKLQSVNLRFVFLVSV